MDNTTDNNQKRILIVEDDFFIMKISRDKLKDEGIEFDEAQDGENALQLIKTNHYDLILLDIVMPKKSGIEVMQTLKQLNIKVPVVIFSNMAQADIKKDLVGLEYKGYFLKASHTIDEMVGLVKSYLKEGES